MANFFIRWKRYNHAKSYCAVLSAKEIKSWARDYALHHQQFLKTGATIKECIKFLDSHYQYVIASPHRGVVKSSGPALGQLLSSEVVGQETLNLPTIEIPAKSNPWEK